MSKAAVRGADRKSGEKTADQPVIEARPMVPRRRLFVTLMIALGLWVAFLVGLYVKTVLPVEKGHRPVIPTTGAPD